MCGLFFITDFLKINNMKNTLLIFAFIVTSTTVFSQTGVSDINFTPQSMLHVHINAVSGNLLQLTNTTTGNGSNIVGFKLNYVGNDINFINNGVGYMSFYTSNLERMRILSDGNVGIGSTAPLEKLRVAGRTFLDPQPGFTANNAKITLALGDDDSGINWGGDGVLDFWSQNTPIGRMKYYSGNEECFSFGTTATSNTDQVIIQSSGTTSANFGLKVKNSVGTDQFVVRSDGNIGIGTTGPAAQLHTTGTVRFANYPSGGNGAIVRTNSTGDLAITNFSGSASDVLLGNGTFTGIPAGSGNYIQNQTSLQSSANYNISGSGNVQTSYQLQGTNVLFNTGSDVYGNIRVLQNNSTTLQDGMYINYNSTGGAAADLKFYANGTSERMRILASNGNVGIGTTGPGAMLDVQGSSGIRIGYSTYDANLVFGNNASWKSGIRVYDNGQAEMRIWTNQPSGEIVLANGYNGDQSAVLPTDGLWVKNNTVGIGNFSVTAPSRKLEVNGDIKLAYGYQVYLGENVSANGKIGINFHTDADPNYWIGKPAGVWTQPLHIGFYTGVKIGANTAYGGTKFYNSSDMATEIMSVGNGDNHVRVAGYLFAQYLNSTDNVVGAGVTGVMIKAGDNYFRTGNASAIKTFLNGNGNGWIENQYAGAQAANYWISGESRTGSWFRNSAAGTGLYNEATGSGIYSPSANLMTLYNASSLQITSAATGAGNLRFDAANPYIVASSYIVMPGGLYVNGGTHYDQNQYQCRGGIHNDNAAYLTIAGGTAAVSYFTGNVGIGVTAPAYNLEVSGSFGFGDGTAGSYRSRTETRNDAGQIATQSGFFQTSVPAPAANWYPGASSWQHLIDCRHSNNGNNYALQIAGSFFDQKLYFRKTNNNPAQAWTELLSSANNPVSVSLASDYTINAAAWATIAPMTVIFTATKTTALVQFTCSGYAYTNSMAYVQFRIWNSTLGSSCGGTNTHMQSYDDMTGTITPWSCAFSKNITGLTPGVSYTLIVQAQRGGIYGTYDAVIAVASLSDSHHMTLTVFP